MEKSKDETCKVYFEDKKNYREIISRLGGNG